MPSVLLPLPQPWNLSRCEALAREKESKENLLTSPTALSALQERQAGFFLFDKVTIYIRALATSRAILLVLAKLRAWSSSREIPHVRGV
jgi:hypothetical protein